MLILTFVNIGQVFLTVLNGLIDICTASKLLTYNKNVNNN